MKFGIIMVPQVPEGHPEPYKKLIEQAEFAEELGYNSIWLTEHHFGMYGRPSMEAIAGYLGARLEKMRIGVAVVVLPLHHPLRVAEDWATLDHLTDGRVELGVGRGNQPAEFEGFQVSRDEARERFNESLTIIRKAWTEERFSYDGEFWTIPEVSVRPKPLQQPHPRIWCPAVSAYSVKMIVNHGVHGLVGPYLTPFDILKTDYFDPWYEATREAGRTDLLLGHNEFIYVGETEEQVRQDIEDKIMWYLRLAAKIWGSRDASKTPAQYANYVEVLDYFATVEFEEVYRDLSLLGTPDLVAEKVAWFEEQGVDELLSFMWFGGLEHEKAMRNMELFATEVMPRFDRTKAMAAATA